MKELFERHHEQLTPEDDQRLWGRVEHTLTGRRSFWQSWRFPVSMAATASAALTVFVLSRSAHETPSLRVSTPVETAARGAERVNGGAPTIGPLVSDGRQEAPIQSYSKNDKDARVRDQKVSKKQDSGFGQEADKLAVSQGKVAESRSFDEAEKRSNMSEEGQLSRDLAAGAPAEAAPSTSPSSNMAKEAPAAAAQKAEPEDKNTERQSSAQDLSKSSSGVIAGGEMHFRGGRKDEVQYQVDGMSAAPEQAAPVPSRPDASGAPNSVGGTTPVNGQAFDAMFFQHYGVNPFIDPEDDKYSTFAVDVDNASYTLMRSYLQRGALPPAEAVRVEEFVNAMRHDYAPPRNSSLSADREWGPSEKGTFAIHLEAAPSPFGPGLVLFRVGLKGKEIAVSERKPANLTFVVDVSGSMARENRLELVKRSLFYLLDQMDKNDRVALVVYGTNARKILPSTSLRNRQEIENAIVRLVPEGSTNAEAGLREGYALANESFNARATNRIILCTDGVANVGLTDADDILDTIGRGARRGIALTAIGVGMGNYNDVLLEKLADKGDGNYYYVDDLGEAKKVFVENLTGTLQTIAKDAKIQVEFVSDAVRRYRLLGYENRDVADKDFRNNAVDAGEVGAGHEVTALFEMKLDRDAVRGPVATVRIRYKDAETGRVTEEARTLRAEDILSRIQNADPTFQMDAAVAEFAEILRHSYWAKDGDLASARSLADRARRAMDSPKDAEEVVSLIGTAEQLWPRSLPPRWQDDDVRPQWEPENEHR